MTALVGRVALVTGAGRGIGRAVALMLAQSGCRVILCARTVEQLQAVEREITNHNATACAVAADLTDDAAVQRLAAESRRIFGTVDVLINNAGWGKRAPVAKANIEDWDQTFRVNLRAPMMLARPMPPARRSSIAAHQPAVSISSLC